MIDVSVSTVIDRPVEEVFGFVRDEANMPRWDSDLLKATRTSQGEFGVGTTFHLDIKPFMGQTEGTGGVVGYEPNRLVELQFDMGKMKPHVFHRFEPAGSGTKFTRRVQMEPSGFMKLMAPMMRRMVHKRNEAYLATLKALLEAG